jgi:hypothetical protein
MERALQAIILPREPRSRATEIPMPETPMLRRASSSGPVMSGVVCVLIAAAAPGFVSSAQAECIVQPNQQAPEGAHWSLHTDRATNRRCWILMDSAGRDLSTAQPQPAPSSGLSSLQSFLGNFTGGPPAPPPQEQAPASPAATPPRKPQPHAVQPRVANAGKADHRARTEQKADARPARQEMTPGARDALFEEFLRWHENQKITGSAAPR